MFCGWRMHIFIYSTELPLKYRPKTLNRNLNILYRWPLWFPGIIYSSSLHLPLISWTFPSLNQSKYCTVAAVGISSPVKPILFPNTSCGRKSETKCRFKLLEIFFYRKCGPSNEQKSFFTFSSTNCQSNKFHSMEFIINFCKFVRAIMTVIYLCEREILLKIGNASHFVMKTDNFVAN